MKLFISEPEERHQGAILVHDEALNDIAEFYHNEHATVETSYETALALAKKLTGDVAQPAPDSAIDVLREIVEYETKSAIELEALTGDEMPELPWMAKAEAVLAAQPPAAPVEIPGLTIDAIHKQTLRMHPADQHKLAEMIAANVGYELTPEPPHPDCPHEHSSAATARDAFLAVLRRYGSEPYTHVAIDAAWNAAVATIDEPQPTPVPHVHSVITGLDGSWHCQTCGERVEVATALSRPQHSTGEK